MVNTKREVKDILQKNNREFKKLGIRQIGLFGSFVSGRQNEQSDVDLLVEFDEGKKSFKNFIAASNLAEDILGRKVEIITPQSLSPHMSPYVVQEVEYVQTS